MYSTRQIQYTPKSVVFTMSMISVSNRCVKYLFVTLTNITKINNKSYLLSHQPDPSLFSLCNGQKFTCKPEQLRFRNLGVKLAVNQSVLRINQNILCLPEFHGCDGRQAELFQCNFQGVNGQLQIFTLEFNQLKNAGIVFIFCVKCSLQSFECLIKLYFSILLLNFSNLYSSVCIEAIEQVDSGSQSDIISICLALQDQGIAYLFMIVGVAHIEIELRKTFTPDLFQFQFGNINSLSGGLHLTIILIKKSFKIGQLHIIRHENLARHCKFDIRIEIKYPNQI